MRPAPYLLKLDIKVANKARDAVGVFAHGLTKPFLEPYPRQKAFALVFDSADIALGVPGQADIDGKWEIKIDLSHTTVGRTKGVDPHDLLYILFHKDVSEKVVEALVMAMVYTADVEANGKNEFNERLVTAEITKLCELVDKSVRNLGMM